ncbi:BTAD domain-containing putative transcriptional regulator [Actinomycetospora sp. OC33-EN08]|uniref:BTAD domain-containing putative transcriptional regulator n=1 Tax=Actinomycetospora aurantiaca TaxID=3129233 RepID=A0ABU8MPZ5_9PSEU
MTATAERTTALRIRDLGDLVVEENGQTRTVPTGTLSTALALLAVHAGRRVGSDTLADAIWGDRTTSRSSSTLDSHVLRLRRVLEPERRSGQASTTVVNERGGYRLITRPDQVDSLRFARLATEAAALLGQGASERVLRRTEEALRMWRGRPYGTAADAPWAAAAVARLDELHHQVRETHIGALLDTGDVARALVELESAIADHPLRERLWAYRITAYQAAGRRADALHTYSEARTVLIDELGLEPGPELRRLHAALLAEDTAAPPARSRPRREPVSRPGALHLPTVRTPILGREAEAAELGHLVAGHPLVTVVGTAGCGKTRLALEVAARAAPTFTDGVWFVDLTSATPDRVPDLVSSTLGLPTPGPADIAGMLRDRRTLVVLDNCEHVLDAVAELVDRILATGGESAVLATSREPLEVPGERLRPLAPLAPGPALALFSERVAATGSEQADRESAARIVEAVDGLPLALELAAGRARLFTLAEIATQVRADASGLSHTGRRAPAHHRSLRGAIDSSYRALPEAEAALHRALGVVPGPFTADLAAALAQHDDVADLLGGLVHRSMLTAVGAHGGASRFTQLATLRSHAQHRSAALGEDHAPRRDAWVEALVDRQPPFGSTALRNWHRELDRNLPALRATLQRTLVDAPSARGVRIAGRLAVYWTFGAGAIEGLHWARTARAVCEEDPHLGNPADRALTALVLGSNLMAQGHHEPGRETLQEGIRAAAGLSTDADLVTAALTLATGPAFMAGDTGLVAELAAATRSLGAGRPELDVLVRHAGFIAPFLTGEDPDMLVRVVDLHRDATAAGNHYTGWVAAVSAVQLLLPAGRFDEALSWVRQAVTDCTAMGMTENFLVAELLADCLALSGDMAAASRALAIAEAQHVRGGMRWPTLEVTENLLDRVVGSVGRDGMERARTRLPGHSLADL